MAHRGLSASHPENTISAFEAAIEQHAHVLELDVHLTSDHEIVVHHDYYLDRTTDGTGAVAAHTLAQLRGLDAGRWRGPGFAGERIPTLDEVLELGRGRVGFEIELKMPSMTLAGRVLERVHELASSEEVEITSGHPPILPGVKELDPRARTGTFFRELPPWMHADLGDTLDLQWMGLLRADVGHFPLSRLRPELVAALRRRGNTVHVSDVNDAATAAEAVAHGVDRISTDDAGLVFAALARRPAH